MQTSVIVIVIGNGNRTEWSPIRSVIVRVITKSDDRAAGVRFVHHEYDYRPNWTTRSLITITNKLPHHFCNRSYLLLKCNDGLSFNFDEFFLIFRFCNHICLWLTELFTILVNNFRFIFDWKGDCKKTSKQGYIQIYKRDITHWARIKKHLITWHKS